MTEGTSRLHPRFWDHQWFALDRLRRGIETVLAELPKDDERTVVDLGCGDRPYEPLIRAHGFRYVGCDLAEGSEVRLQPSQKVSLPDGSAKGVVSFQVLEHVWDLDWYLGEARRLLEADGWLILSTHGVWPYHAHPTDYRRWTREGLVEELQTRGFRVQRVIGLVGPLAWTTLVRLLGIKKVLGGVPGLVGLAACLMNLRMLVEDAVTPTTVRERDASIYVTLSKRA